MYATLHMELMILKLELSKYFTDRTKDHYRDIFNRGKKDLGNMLLYYLKIAIRYWRPARDNWCMRDKTIGETGNWKRKRWDYINCISQPPMYRYAMYYKRR